MIVEHEEGKEDVFNDALLRDIVKFSPQYSKQVVEVEVLKKEVAEARDIVARNSRHLFRLIQMPRLAGSSMTCIL